MFEQIRGFLYSPIFDTCNSCHQQHPPMLQCFEARRLELVEWRRLQKLKELGLHSSHLDDIAQKRLEFLGYLIDTGRINEEMSQKNDKATD